MNVLIAVLCVGAVIALCVLAIRRGSNDGGYRRRFESRYRHYASSDAASDATSPLPWLAPMGSGDLGSHHVPDAGSHCHASHDGGGCGDGGSS